MFSLGIRIYDSPHKHINRNLISDVEKVCGLFRSHVRSGAHGKSGEPQRDDGPCCRYFILRSFRPFEEYRVYTQPS